MFFLNALNRRILVLEIFCLSFKKNGIWNFVMTKNGICDLKMNHRISSSIRACLTSPTNRYSILVERCDRPTCTNSYVLVCTKTGQEVGTRSRPNRCNEMMISGSAIEVCGLADPERQAIRIYLLVQQL